MSWVASEAVKRRCCLPRTSGGTWTIEYAESVQKNVGKLDATARRQIRGCLEERIAVLDDPRSVGKALKRPLGDLWRYRVGDYRILCEIKDQKLVIQVVKTDHRREVYR